VRGGLGLLLIALPLGAAAAKPSQTAPAPRPAAKLMLLSDDALAMEAFRYAESPVVRLEGGAVGYLDRTHTRALATRDEVRRIPGPPGLQSVCVADDGRTTFVKSQSNYEETLWRAERFDAPLDRLGVKPIGVGHGAGTQRARWVVQADSGSVLVECEAGRVQRLGPPAQTVYPVYWTEKVHLLRLGRDPKGPEICLLRMPGADTFKELPGCYARGRPDGTTAIEKRSLEPVKSGEKPPPPVCYFVLDHDGNKLPCSADSAPANRPGKKLYERASLTLARVYASGHAVAPGPERGLYDLGPDAELRPERRIGGEALGQCVPLLAIEPVFWCGGDPEYDVVVRVAADGKLVEELRRRRALDQHAGGRTRARFHHTMDGGLAVGGDCDGHVTDVACVRDRTGVWRTVAFSKTLIAALARTAPATRLIPTPDGRLYVGTGTASPGFGITPGSGGEVRILIFDAARGKPTAIKKPPTWIVHQLADLTDSSEFLSDHSHPGMGFAGDRRIRVWPLQRHHPAFDTVEYCRLDVTLDGNFETDCNQGRLFRVGAFGLLQKQVGEIYETVNAGGSWARVALPPGLDTEDISCSPLGCRIGPYWRAGWGEPAGAGR
jgi:hypothetical protein